MAHRAAGHRLDSKAPQISAVLRGIARSNGSAVARKEAATLDVVRDAVRALTKGDSVKALRDRAILLIGVAAALRRSELAAIDVGHLCFVPDGLMLTLPRRKTDQEGEGSEIGIPFGRDVQYCPVRTAQALIDRCELAAGPLFRSVTRGGAVKASRMTDRDIARALQEEARGAAALRAFRRSTDRR